MRTKGLLRAIGRSLVACALFGGILAPFATAWGEEDSDNEKMKPPGDCTEKQLRNLKQIQKLACTGANEPKECLPSDTCDQLLTKRNNFMACKAARLSVMNICYRGGDKGHKTQVEQLANGQVKCEDRLKSCPPPRFGTCPGK